MKWYSIVSTLLVSVISLSACGPAPQPPSVTPPTSTATPVATPTPQPTPLPTQSPTLSREEAIAMVQSFIRTEAQSPTARQELSKIYDKAWQAQYIGDGSWQVTGLGSWRLFERTKLVQPADETARTLLKNLAAVAQTPISTPIPPLTPILTPSPTPQRTTTPTPSASEMVARLRPSVVKIVTDKATGSGVVIDKDGFVLTNNHVIEGSTSMRVVVEDQWTVAAQVVGRDEVADLALLKITGRDFKVAQLGDSNKIKPGDEVIAIGYPLNLPGAATVTKGIISAIRPQANPGNVQLQTDTALNPGNSGGPLFNGDGEVVGINVSVIRQSSSGTTVEGLNFAVAINTAKSVLPQLKAGQSIVKVNPSPTPNTVSGGGGGGSFSPTPFTPTPTATSIRETKYINPKYWYTFIVPAGWQFKEKTPEEFSARDLKSGAAIFITIEPHNRFLYPDFDRYSQAVKPIAGDGMTGFKVQGENKMWIGKPVEGYEFGYSYSWAGMQWTGLARSFILGDIRYWISAEGPIAVWGQTSTIGRALESLKTDIYVNNSQGYSVSTPQEWYANTSNSDNIFFLHPQGKVTAQVNVSLALKKDYPNLNAYMVSWTVKAPEGSKDFKIESTVKVREQERVPGYKISYSYTASNGINYKARALILLTRERAFWLFIKGIEIDWPELEPIAKAIEERFNVAP